MSRSKRFTIFASGRGSNFEAIMRAKESGVISHEPVSLFCDRADALVIEKAKQWGISCDVIEKNKGEAREDFDARIWEKVSLHQPDYLVLAGYMKVMSSFLIQKMSHSKGFSKILNVHPSLLPAFPGIGSYEKAFNYGSKITGVTVHLVNEGVDEGPICAQQSFEIDPSDSLEEIEKKGLEIEHKLFPQVIEWVLNEKFTIEHREWKESKKTSTIQRRSFVRPS